MIWGADPDAHFSQAAIFGTLLITVIFVAGVFGWGRLLCRSLRLKERGAFEELLVGSASLAVLGQGLGLAGLVGAPWRWLWLLVPASGLAASGLAAIVPRKKPVLRWRRPSLAQALELAVAVVLLSRFLRASLLFGHTDPLIYHLYAPRLWWEVGRIYLPSYSTAVYVSSYWESFLLWGCAIFAGPSGRGLIEFHLFAQWVHVAICMVGTALALRKWLASVFPRASPFLPLAVLSGIASLPLKSVSMTAKSDWADIFWLVGGAVLLARKERKALTDFLGGALLGLGFVTRLTSVFFLFGFVPAFAWVCLRRHGAREGSRRLARIGGAAALAMAPILLRNYVASGNPFFPWFNSIFSSPLIGPTAAAYPEVHGVPLTLDRANVLDKLYFLGTQSPLGVAVVLWPLAERFSAWLRELRWVAAATALSFVLVIVWPYSQQFHFRWVGAPLVLQGVLGVAVLAAFAEKKRVIALGASAVMVFALLGFGIEWEGWDKLVEGPSPELRIRDSRRMFIGGAAKAWLRQNADPSSLIVSTFDPGYYYLIPHKVSNLASEASLDREAHLRSPESILRILRDHEARYLLDTLSFFTMMGRRMYYWGHYSEKLAPLLMEHPESIVFSDDVISIVVDLADLEERVFLYCVKKR